MDMLNVFELAPVFYLQQSFKSPNKKPSDHQSSPMETPHDSLQEVPPAKCGYLGGGGGGYDKLQGCRF